MFENSWERKIKSKEGSVELTASAVRLMDENSQKIALFGALRECNLPTISIILQANRALINSKLFGYEGSDVFNRIKNMLRLYGP